MVDTDYSIDLRTRSSFWARMASILSGGPLVTPDKGSQMDGTSAHGVVGDSVVTDERYMQISTVWACIRLISTVTASLPLDVYQTKNDQRTKVDNSHPLAKLLRFRPNNFMTALEFREAMTMQLCAYGNA